MVGGREFQTVGAATLKPRMGLEGEGLLYMRRCVSLIHSGSNGSVAYLYKPTKATGHSFRDLFCFYRAMHYSAKRGLAIACRLSVRLSVTLVDCDHIGWNSSKIMSRLVSMRRLLSADPTTDLFQGEQPEIWAQSDPPLLI